MGAALKCCSYGWNVFKRIINNRFSSSTVLFLTNMQQLKALISSEGCSNGGAFRVRHSSRHISVNRMLWPEPGNHSFFFIIIPGIDVVLSLSLLLGKCFSPACKRNAGLGEKHVHFLARSGRDHSGRCSICSHRRGGLTLQSGASGSPRSLPLPQRLGALGRRQELINDNARSAGGEEPRLAREQRCRGCYCTMFL